MDLSELARSKAASNPFDAAPVERLQGLLAQIGAEIAGPLTSAIERINTLAGTGRIDPASLRALRDEVEAARQAGMMGQQLTRFAAGRIRQSHEVLQLGDVVRHVLANRQRQTEVRGVTLQPDLASVSVVADASLLFSLLNSTVEWALANAVSPIEFSVQARSGGLAPRFGCRFGQRMTEDATGRPPVAAVDSLDSLTWRLIEQTAWAIGLQIDRRHDAGIATLTFTFPRTAELHAVTESALGAGDGFGMSTNSQPLAGSHVLVIASRREMRMRIREALRSMSLIVDFVNSVDEAAAFCREGLPHAIIIEAIQSGERFAQFRAGISQEVPGFVFIEIVEEGSAFEMAGEGNGEVARVGREVLAESLPSALLFELSKNL